MYDKNISLRQVIPYYSDYVKARKKSVGENWMQKAAEEADLVLSDDDYSDGEKVGSPSNQIKS